MVIFWTLTLEAAVGILAHTRLPRQINGVVQTRGFPGYVFEFKINPLLLRELGCIAFIHVDLARRADPSGSTFTLITRPEVETLGSVFAWGAFAFVLVTTGNTVAFTAG